VELSIDGADEITLKVRDEGVGMPESIVPADTNTSGFNLVYMLASGQLSGTVDFIENKGTTVEIKFRRLEDTKRF